MFDNFIMKFIHIDKNNDVSNIKCTFFPICNNRVPNLKMKDLVEIDLRNIY